MQWPKTRDRRDPRQGRRTASAAWPLLVAILLFGAAPAPAHPLAPALLSLERDPRAGSEFLVTWKVPLRLAAGVRLEPVLPEACSVSAPTQEGPEGSAWITRLRLRCPDASLAGERLGVRGLPARGAGAVVRLAGAGFQQVVTASDPVVRIPEEATRGAVFRGYGALGMRHLLFGFDHVLFVLGLLLLVRGRRALLATVTAFTLGHSVTLAAVSLGFVRVPTAWVEVAIACTLLATALAVLPSKRRRSLFARAPWRVAAGFGLLHGLGFAGALSEIGLPPGEIPLALLSFNLGIEAGQLAIVALAIAAHGVVFPLRRPSLPWTQPPWPTRLRWLAAYGLGGLSAYWLLDRLGTALLA